MGRRHASALLALGCQVIVFDPLGDFEAPSGALVAATEAAALDAASAVVVASPTAEHARQTLAAVDRGCHVLVEKPLATDAESARHLADAARRAGVVLAVGMNLRFHPGPRTVRDVVREGRIGRPLSGHFSFGYYLPSWRPGADYRPTYSARSELGGGVLFDVIHELDYATWILGPVTEVGALVDQVSDLELDVEDVVKIHARHESGTVSSFDLDYLDRAYRRGCRIVGSSGTVQWSWADEQVRLYEPDGKCEVFDAMSDPAPTYIREMEEFLIATNARAAIPEGSLATGEEGAASLAIVDAVRESARSLRHVS